MKPEIVNHLKSLSNICIFIRFNANEIFGNKVDSKMCLNEEEKKPEYSLENLNIFFIDRNEKNTFSQHFT